MRKLNKKLVLSIVALVMISTLGIGKALGYFTAHTNATGGYKMDLGFTDTKIEEDVDKDGKHVVITNVGDYEVNDDNKDKDYNIVVIQEFTPVVYDDQGNLIANWQQVYETE